MGNICKSLYKEMVEYFKANPGKLYENQNFEEAGKEETLFILWEEDLPRRLQKKKAQKLLNSLYKYLNNEDTYENLIDYINKSKFISYYYAFYKLLKLHVKEGFIDKEKVFKAAVKFTTESINTDEIKLGIIMLAMFQNKTARDILEVLGTHSEYTMYVVAAVEQFDFYNSFIFELAKRTYGYGKFYCLYNLEPVSNKIKRWIIEEGLSNVVLKSMSAIVCIDKVDASWYLKNSRVKKKHFSAVSKLLYYILSVDKNDIYEIEDSLNTVKIYLKYAETLADSFYDLCAIAYIKKWMRPYWYRFGEDVYKKNGWTSNIESEIVDKCKKLLQNKKWIKVLYNAMETLNEKAEHYIFAANTLGIKLNFDDLEKILIKAPYDIEIYYYIKENGNVDSIKKLLGFVKTQCLFDIACSGPLDISEDDVPSEFIPDICLLYTLKSLRNLKDIELELPLKSIHARLTECRKEAIDYLKGCKKFWTEEVEKKLRELLDIEPNKYVSRKIKRLLGERETSIKERKYVDISKEIVKPHVKDTYLFSTEIAGVYYRDISVVEDELKAGNLLFLKREPDNIYDENAIMVTTEEGYMVGYIPRKINTHPKNLMDGGKYLYGRINEFSIDKNYISIDVYLSYKDVQEAIEEIINMTKEPQIRFVQ